MSKPFNFRGNITDSTKEHIFYYAEVVDITDPAGAGRIRARIKLVDDVWKTDDSLPWSYPLIPRFFNVVPQIGEGVRLFLYNVSNDPSGTLNRSYIGPILGQDQDLPYQDKRIALGTQSDIGGANAKKKIREVTWGGGIYPDPQDVAIQGRDNADIILTSSKIDLRAGKFVPGNPVELNRSNPSRIQLNLVNNKESVANIIADKINLISYTGKPAITFNNLSDAGLDSSGTLLQSFLGGDGELTQDNLPVGGVLHPLVYGDKLIDFCKLVQKFVQNHTHPYGQMVPDVATDESDGIKKISQFNFSEMISHRIRIN